MFFWYSLKMFQTFCTCYYDALDSKGVSGTKKTILYPLGPWKCRNPFLNRQGAAVLMVKRLPVSAATTSIWGIWTWSMSRFQGHWTGENRWSTMGFWVSQFSDKSISPSKGWCEHMWTHKTLGILMDQSEWGFSQTYLEYDGFIGNMWTPDW